MRKLKENSHYLMFNFLSTIHKQLLLIKAAGESLKLAFSSCKGFFTTNPGRCLLCIPDQGYGMEGPGGQLPLLPLGAGAAMGTRMTDFAGCFHYICHCCFPGEVCRGRAIRKTLKRGEKHYEVPGAPSHFPHC